MRIELEQLRCPEFAEEVMCSLCKRPFTLGVVIARALTDSGVDSGEVCPECALHLADGPMGQARPGDFPGLEDSGGRLADWQEPEFESAEEMARAEGLDW